MTITELIERLREYPGDLPVILDKDAEGNASSPLSDMAVSNYEAESSWSGHVVHDDDLEEYPDAISVLCIWPAN